MPKKYRGGEDMIKKNKGIFITAIAAAGFGSTTIFAQLAYDLGANIMTLLSFRFGLASVLFLVVLKLSNVQWNLTLKQVLTLIALGFAGYAVFTTIYFYGVSLIPASLAGFLLSIYPIIVCVVAYLLGDEVMSQPKCVALLSSVAGLIFVLGPTFEQINILGVISVLLAATLYSLYVVGSNRLLRTVHWLPGSAVITMSAAGFFLSGGIITNQLTLDVNRGVLYCGIGLALLATLLAIGGFYLGLSMIGPAKASIVSTLEPLVTAIVASIIFGEQLTIGQLLGGSLIILSIIILQKAREEKYVAPKSYSLNKLNEEYRF